MYNRFYKSRRVVGHILMSFITFSWIILFNYINTSAEGVRGSEHIDKREHYYSSGKKIPLLRHRMHFAVKLKNDKEDRGYITDITGSIGLKMREEVIYYPNHGIYLCKARDADGLSHDDVIRQLNNIPDVEFVQPVYVFTEGNPMIMTEEFVAQFIPDMTETEISALNSANNVEIVKKMDFLQNTYILKVNNLKNRTTLDVANLYYEMDEVIWSHPDWIRRMEPRGIPNDSLFPNQWHLNNTGQNGGTLGADIDAPAAWDTTRGSSNVIVAIIDTGIDIDHEDLNVGTKIVAGRDVVDNDNDPRPGPGESHGTAVAGVSIAAQNNGIGVSGSAPGCKLMAIRLLASGSSTSDEAEAFTFASQNGADVISNSWGPPDGNGISVPLPDITRAAIDLAVTQGRGGKGCVILFAAGNGNESVDLDGFAAYNKTIAVGASNDRDERSAYSDFGNSLDIMAPSSDRFRQGITTTDRMGTKGYSSTNYNNGFGGTSSACPLAAGVAALIISVNPNLTWQQVHNILKDTADKINPSDAQYDTNGFSTRYGYGRINAGSAVTAAALTGGCETTCFIQLTGTSPVLGVDICVRNPCDNPRPVELKIWAEYQGQKYVILNQGADSATALPAGFQTCANVFHAQSLPSGVIWGIRLIDPITGREFCLDTVVGP